jgi:hypothetical protein
VHEQAGIARGVPTGAELSGSLGGLFLFDLTSPFSFQAVACAACYRWRRTSTGFGTARTIAAPGLQFDLTFFIADDAGTYRREDEIQEERAWTEQEMRELLAETGLEFLAAYDGWRARKPGPESERLFFVARRPM